MVPLPYHNGETCHPLNRGFSLLSLPQNLLPQSFRTQCEMLLCTYVSRFSVDSLYQQRRKYAVCQLRQQRLHTALQGVRWERMPPLSEKSHTAAHRGMSFSGRRCSYCAERFYDCQTRLFWLLWRGFYSLICIATLGWHRPENSKFRNIDCRFGK